MSEGIPAAAQRRTTLVLLLFAVSVFFAQFWKADLYDDPILYASIARQMVETGEWWTPHWGPVEYFRKPPLLLWLTALNFRLFGVSPAAAVFWSAAAAAISVVLTYRLARRWFGEWAAIWAGIVLAATPQFIKGSISLRLDSTIVCLTLASALAAFSATRSRPRLHLVAGTMAGLAVLAKGAPGVLALTPYAFLTLVRPREGFGGVPPPWWRTPYSWLGLALAVGIPGVWYASMHRNHGEVFLAIAVMGEGVGHLVENRRAPDPWAHVRVILHYYWPWLPFLLVGSFAYGRRLVRGEWRREEAYPAFFGLGYSALLALSATKHYRYVQPLYPFLAMVSAIPLAGLMAGRRRRGFLLGIGVAALIIALVTTALPVRLHRERNAGIARIARELASRDLEVAVSPAVGDHNLISALLFHGGVTAKELQARFFPHDGPPSGRCFLLIFRAGEEDGLQERYELSEISDFENDDRALKLGTACRPGT